VLGELVQTTAGKWITHPPSRCPNDHRLGPNQVLVGHHIIVQFFDDVPQREIDKLEPVEVHMILPGIDAPTRDELSGG
jgi:hypothetical protein